MRVIVMTRRTHFHPQIWKNVLFEKNHMSIGGCNKREKKLSLQLTDKSAQHCRELRTLPNGMHTCMMLKLYRMCLNIKMISYRF